jgi:hypothetical protein
MCEYMDQSYLPFLYIVSQKMIPHFDMFGFGMEHKVLCNTYGTGAVSLKSDMGILWQPAQENTVLLPKPIHFGH